MSWYPAGRLSYVCHAGLVSGDRPVTRISIDSELWVTDGSQRASFLCIHEIEKGLYLVSVGKTNFGFLTCEILGG